MRIYVFEEETILKYCLVTMMNQRYKQEVARKNKQQSRGFTEVLPTKYVCFQSRRQSCLSQGSHFSSIFRITCHFWDRLTDFRIIPAYSQMSIK